jgi:sec-independent protein translocase protein TatA
MIGNIGDLPYVIVIAVIVLIGGSQLPKIARNLGLAGKEFRKAQTEAEEEHQSASRAPTPPPPQPLGPAAQTPVTEDSVTMSKSELDALLRAREEQARREQTGSSS